MSESVALDPLPEALASVMRDAVKLSRLIDSQARVWLETQAAGPDKRRLLAILGALARDSMLLEQMVVRDVGRSA